MYASTPEMPGIARRHTLARVRTRLAAALLVLIAGCSVQVGAGGAGGSGNGRGGDGGDAVSQDGTSVGVDGEDGASGVGIDIQIGDG